MKPKHIALTVISAVTTGLLYTFYRLGLASYVTLIPYFYVVYSVAFAEGKARAYRLGLIFSLPYYISVLYWFCYQYPLDYVGFSMAMSAAYIALAWLGLSLLYSLTMALVPTVATLAARSRIGRKYKWLTPVMLASVWTVVEWMHTKTFLGVPWARLALTQQSYIANLQIASVLGSYGVTFIIVLVNAAVAYGIYTAVNNKQKKKCLMPCVLAFVLVISNFVYGAVAIKLDEDKNTDAVVVSALQGNMSSSEKWSDGGVDEALDIYTELIKEASGQGAKIVVLPETALPIDLRYESWLVDTLCELAEEEDVTMFVGAFDIDVHQDRVDNYNAIYKFNPDGTYDEDTYIKRKLVPFGEYLPCEEIFCTLFPFLKELNLFQYVLTAGTESKVFDTECGCVGGLICFDSIYELLSVQSTKDGAQLLILGTNDSWFADSSAIYEHNGQAVLRAIENRRFVVRAANTGLSSIISSNGEVLSTVDVMTEGSITEAVSFRSDMSFYTEHPNLFIAILHIFIYGVFVLSFGAKIFAKKRKNT